MKFLKFRIAILCAALLCIGAAASAAPKSDDDDLARGVNGNGNGLGHAYGLLKKKGDAIAESAAAAMRIPVVGDHHPGVIRLGKGDDWDGHPGPRYHGSGSDSGVGGPRPTGVVSAVPEPTGALLFGAGTVLVAARLRRR